MFQLSKDTIALLEDIERRIDPETEEDFVDQWKNFIYDDFKGDVFVPVRKKLSPASVNLPAVNINDALEDYDLMLRHQMQGVSAALNSTRHNLSVRSNYGTGITTSIFGAEIFKMPYKNNTLPTTYSLNDTDKITKIVERGMPDINTGFGKNVFEFGELCREVFEKYPKIKKYVTAYHPDTQGPLDTCELLWGCEMFYAMYDEPELVHDMLRLVTDTYKAVLDKWYSIFPRNPEFNPHWSNIYHRGSIVLRDDSAMNLSPELYTEFGAPYDNELLETYDGGVIHFCGRGDHYIDIIAKMPKLYGINMSQPQYNDMEKIFKNTVDKGIKILGFNSKWIPKLENRPEKFNHNMNA